MGELGSKFGAEHDVEFVVWIDQVTYNVGTYKGL